MPLVPAICTQCGATISADKDKDAMVCPYCNTLFIVEKAIQNFTNVYNITAQNVYVQGEMKQDYRIEGSVLKEYTGNSSRVRIPDGVKKIGKGAFAGSMIEYVEMSDDVIEVDLGAFALCNYLKEIHFSTKLECISGNSVLTQLESIYVSSYSLGKVSFSFGSIDFDDNRFKCEAPKLFNIYVDGVRLQENDERLKYFAMTPIGYPFYLKMEKERKEEEQRKRSEYWRQNGLCDKCGSKISGIFVRKCSNRYCGKVVDY